MMIMPSPSVQGAADLVVGSPSVSHSGPGAEASFTLSAIVSNTGDGASAPTTLRYYRSTDATIAISDTAVGTQAVAGLSPSGSVSGSVGLRAPSSPGIYYYGACVDAVADESDTANNCSASVQVTVRDAGQPSRGAPDLAVGSPSVSDSGPVSEASFTLSAIVSNTGDGASAPTTLRYYRSTDATIATSDTAVGTQAVAGLSPSGSVSGSVGLTAPSSPGIYYYGACVDAVAGESDTTNNCSASVQISVAEAEGHPDLRISGIVVLIGSGRISAGETFSILTTVSNTGDGASAATTLRYYRSTDATITTSDTALGTGSVGRLGAARASSESISLTAPSSPGIYYYGACVDAVADESDTANNCASSAPVEVLRAKRQPDLVVRSPSVSPDSCAPGARFTVSATVSNTGDGQSPATTLRYYRSGDKTITTSDTEAGTDMVGGLAPGRSSGESVELTAPSSPGAYNYGACVDAVAGESDTTNNCSVLSVRTHVLDAQAIRDDGNGTRAGATNLGDITDNSSPIGEGRVYYIGGPVDRVDYFRFSLSEEKRVEFVLRTVHRLETRTDLFLEDATGGVLRQETSTAVGPLWLRETLQAGTYYLRADDDSGCRSVYVFGLVVSQ